mmetsp:Transcript_23586/g.74319  ORF Transcript_23586/g.74319 Transcript_23586/m.74319 type:complete len:205 (+) Transcript_23586:290-904(+)
MPKRSRQRRCASASPGSKMGRKGGCGVPPSAPAPALAATVAGPVAQGDGVASAACAGGAAGSRSRPWSHFCGFGPPAGLSVAEAGVGVPAAGPPSAAPSATIRQTPHRNSPVDCATSPRFTCVQGGRRQKTAPKPTAWYFGSAEAAISATAWDEQGRTAALWSPSCASLGTPRKQPLGHSDVSSKSTPPESAISSLSLVTVSGV